MICVGESVEEAFYYTHIAVKACEYQVSDNLFMRKHCSLFHICRLSSVNSGEILLIILCLAGACCRHWVRQSISLQ